MSVDSELLNFKKYNKEVTQKALKRILRDIKNVKEKHNGKRGS